MTRCAALALAAAATIAGCRHADQPRPIVTPVRVQVVGTAGVEGAPRYSAAMLPASRVDLAFKVPGYVASIAQVGDGAGHQRSLQDGDRVKRGQELARLRPADYDVKIEQARSQQAEVEAALAQAKQAFDRSAGLYERKSLTRTDYDAAKAAYDTVLAHKAGAAALEAEAQNALDDSSLRSPMDGEIIRRLVEVGSLVGPGTPGFVIADTSSIKVLFGAPDVVVRRLSTHQPVTLTTAAYPNERFPGRITSLAPAASPGSLVFDIEVTVPNKDGRLKPGMVASFELEPSRTPGQLAVPLSAILRSRTHPDGYAVFVVDERSGGARAQMREVTLGDMIAAGITVPSGLRQGERVIVSGATIVADGQAVEILQ